MITIPPELSEDQKISILESCKIALNEMRLADIDAVSALVNYSVPCLDEVETRGPAIPREENGQLRLGLMGVLNGVLDYVIGKRICASVDTSTGNVVAFLNYAPAKS